MAIIEVAAAGSFDTYTAVKFSLVVSMAPMWVTGDFAVVKSCDGQ